MNRDRALLLGYLVAVVAASLVHDAWLLATGLVLVLASAGGRAGPLAWRVLRATGPYLAAVAAGWLGLAMLAGPGGSEGAAGPALARLALRVLLLAALAFRVLPAVSLARALSFSRTLRYVLVLAMSQLLAFRRLFGDFRLALTARTPRRVGPRTAVRHGAATAAWFLRRAEHDAGTLTQALEARGFFLDRD
ncbi:MAG: hypothetical protein IPK64_17220 [bacterium]|nr:hypothetical protein [bacterium]